MPIIQRKIDRNLKKEVFELIFKTVFPTFREEKENYYIECKIKCKEFENDMIQAGADPRGLNTDKRFLIFPKAKKFELDAILRRYYGINTFSADITTK